MIELRAPNYDDPHYDNCGNTTKAILDINGIRISLCDYCIGDLRNSLMMYDKTIFCYKCNNFIMSKDGFLYGGSCKKLAEKNGEIIDQELSGYKYCVDSMNTCNDAVPR